MVEIVRKGWRIIAFWRVYTRFLKEVNLSAKKKPNLFEDILRSCPVEQDDVIRISVSGIKRGSADNLADIHRVFMTHRPQGLFCLYRSSHHCEKPFP